MATNNNLVGQRHLVKCRCVMQQFKKLQTPPVHQFVVFSILEQDTGVVREKFAQCNNCGLIHKVTDFCKSEILNKEDLRTLITIDEIKMSLPQNLVMILENNDVDISTWENTQHIYENEQWGNFVVLFSEDDDDKKQGKILQILGANIFKVSSFTRNEYAK